jgi:hypothetical protein
MKQHFESFVDKLDISEKVKERFKRILQQNIKDSNGVELNPNHLELMFEHDPSNRGKYLRWMTDLYKNSKAEIFMEDLYKVNESLELFEKVKFKLKLEERNILNYSSLNELWSKIKVYKDDKESTLSNKQLKGDTKVDGEYDILFENDNYFLIVPKTHRSACYWGSGSRWCTAHTMNEKTYLGYADKGPLGIIYYKNGNLKNNVQFHIETSQYMDIEDRPIDPEGLFTQYPDVLDAFVDYIEKKEYPFVKQPELSFYQKAFLHSLEKGKSSLSRIYLAYGADVDGIDNDCVSGIPICKAIYIKEEKEAIKLIKMLLKYGAMTNVEEGFINLAHMVASTGKIKILELLVKNGMNINVKDFLGRTPLHSAFMLGKVEMAKELMNYGLDANEKDNYGKTPMDLAKEMKTIVIENKEIKKRKKDI